MVVRVLIAPSTLAFKTKTKTKTILPTIIASQFAMSHDMIARYYITELSVLFPCKIEILWPCLLCSPCEDGCSD